MAYPGYNYEIQANSSSKTAKVNHIDTIYMYREKKRKEIVLRDGFLVDLKDMNGHATSSGELLVADMTFEVLGFLVLNQYLFVIKFSVAVIAPHLRRNPLLLLPHRKSNLP